LYDILSNVTKNKDLIIPLEFPIPLATNEESIAHAQFVFTHRLQTSKTSVVFPIEFIYTILSRTKRNVDTESNQVNEQASQGL
jgi:hypothetical protein